MAVGNRFDDPVLNELSHAGPGTRLVLFTGRALRQERPALRLPTGLRVLLRLSLPLWEMGPTRAVWLRLDPMANPAVLTAATPDNSYWFLSPCPLLLGIRDMDREDEAGGLPTPWVTEPTRKSVPCPPNSS
jgi:hypothetical protein